MAEDWESTPIDPSSQAPSAPEAWQSTPIVPNANPKPSTLQGNADKVNVPWYQPFKDVLPDIADQENQGLSKVGNSAKGAYTDAGNGDYLKAAGDVAGGALGALQAFPPAAIASGLGKSLIGDPTRRALGIAPANAAYAPGDTTSDTVKKTIGNAAELGGSMVAPSAIGGLMSKAARMVGRWVIPEATPEAKLLTDEGVQLTPGQNYPKNSQFRNSEDLTERLPVIGPIISAAKSRANDDFIDAYLNRTLNQVGDSLPEGLSAREKLGYVQKSLDDKYEAVKPFLKVTPSNDFEDSVNALQASDPLGLQEPQQKQLDAIVNYVKSQGPMDGTAFKALDSYLYGKGSSYVDSNNPDQEALGNAIFNVRKVLRYNLADQNPEYADQLDTLNNAWRDFLVARNASTRRAASLGEFSPVDASSALRKSSPSAFAVGKAPNQDLVDAAQSQLPDSIGNMGSAAGVKWSNALSNPIGTLKGLLVAPAYTPKGEKIFSDIATRKPDPSMWSLMKPKGVARKAAYDLNAQEDDNEYTH